MPGFVLLFNRRRSLLSLLQSTHLSWQISFSLVRVLTLAATMTMHCTAENESALFASWPCWFWKRWWKIKVQICFRHSPKQSSLAFSKQWSTPPERYISPPRHHHPFSRLRVEHCVHSSDHPSVDDRLQVAAAAKEAMDQFVLIADPQKAIEVPLTLSWSASFAELAQRDLRLSRAIYFV